MFRFRNLCLRPNHTDSDDDERSRKSKDPHRRSKRKQKGGPSSAPLKVGSYAISPRLLGRGATGAVHEGEHRLTGDKVAIKIVESQAASAPNEVVALRRVAAMHHPNICSFYEHYFGNGKHYIVMEACEGGELFQQVEASGHLTEERARHLAGGMVSGVAYMHARGVAHRDLKLENVLLDLSGTVPKICDFGLAHVYERGPDSRYINVRLTRCCGTKSYTPPEVLQAMPYDGFLVDVWSLGVCIFAMVAGFFPLEVAKNSDWRYQRLIVAQQEGRSTVETIYAFYDRTCPFSAPLADLLDGMLQINPHRRATLKQVSASPWLPPDRGACVTTNLELGALGHSTVSIHSSACSPSSLSSTSYAPFATDDWEALDFNTSVPSDRSFREMGEGGNGDGARGTSIATPRNTPYDYKSMAFALQESETAIPAK